MNPSAYQKGLQMESPETRKAREAEIEQNRQIAKLERNQWLELPLTQDFLAKLRAKRIASIALAESSACSTQTAEDAIGVLKHNIRSKILDEVITYATTGIGSL